MPVIMPLTQPADASVQFCWPHMLWPLCLTFGDPLGSLTSTRNLNIGSPFLLSLMDSCLSRHRSGPAGPSYGAKPTVGAALAASADAVIFLRGILSPDK